MRTLPVNSVISLMVKQSKISHMLTVSFTPLSYLVLVCVSFFSLYLVFSCLPHFLFSPTESSCQWVMSLIQSCCKMRLNSMQTSRNFIHLDLTVCNPKLLFAIIDTDTVSQLRSCILGGVNLRNAIWLGLFIFNYSKRLCNHRVKKKPSFFLILKFYILYPYLH